MRDCIFVLYMIGITFLFVMLLWRLDVSVSAANMQSCMPEGNAIVMQGLFETATSPRVSYHVALMGLSGLYIGMLAAMTYWRFRKR